METKPNVATCPLHAATLREGQRRVSWPRVVCTGKNNTICFLLGHERGINRIIPLNLRRLLFESYTEEVLSKAGVHIWDVFGLTLVSEYRPGRSSRHMLSIYGALAALCPQSS